MDKDRYVSTAIQELLNPTFEVTRQHLEVMDVELENELPRVARINLELHDETVAVYFYIKNERFFIVVNVSKVNSKLVEWVWIESGHRVYLTAISKIQSFLELSKYFPFSDLTGWSIGELRKNGKSKHQFTRVSYEPILNEAYSLEEKLIYLLKELEEYSEAMQKLVEHTGAYISVCRNQYISANAGIHLNCDIIHRLSSMNLELDIDTYISGNEIE